VSWAFRGDTPEPMLDSIKRWRTCAEPGRRRPHQGVDRPHAWRGLPMIGTTGETRDDNWHAACQNKAAGSGLPYYLLFKHERNLSDHGYVML